MDDGQEEVQAVWSDDEWNAFEIVRFEADQEAYNVVAEIFGLRGAPLPVPPRMRSTV